MCPACLTTAAIVLLGATNTGGVTAVLVKNVLRPSDQPQELSPSSITSQEENQHE